MDVTRLPFSELLGLEQVVHDGGNAIQLVPRPEHLNHVGSIHAGVVFTVAETATAVAMIDAFPDLVGHVLPVLRTSSVKYRRPASATITARGEIQQSLVDALRADLSDKGRGLVKVTSHVWEGSHTILSGEFVWFVSRIQETP